MLRRRTKAEANKIRRDKERRSRPHEKGLYLRDNGWILFVDMPDGRKVSRRVPIEDTDTNAEFSRKVEAVRAELLAEADAAARPDLETCIMDYSRAKGLRPKSVEILRLSLRDFDDIYNANKCRAVVDSILARGDLSNESKRTYLKRIRAFFAWCELPDPTAKRVMPKGRSRSRVPTDAEVQILLDVIDHRHRPMDSLFVRLLLATGARCGTVEALRPCDMDTGEWSIRLYNVKISKSYDVRIPIKDAETRRLWSEVVEGLPSDTALFDKAAPQRLKQTMYRLFPANADGERLSPHSLRHLMATRLMRAGVNPAIAAKILGHASPAITLAIYTTVSQDDVNRAFG